jgi:hypothetical protein
MWQVIFIFQLAISKLFIAVFSEYSDTKKLIRQHLKKLPKQNFPIELFVFTLSFSQLQSKVGQNLIVKDKPCPLAIV